ncbi:MAG: DUF4838 domain-containing protein, partial [Thermoguttaceae bacterium]
MNAAVLILTLTLGANSPVPVTLVDGERPCCSIVTPDEASPTVRRASVELAAYLKRISSAEIPVVGESQFENGKVATSVGRVANPSEPADTSPRVQAGKTRIDVGPTRRALAALPERFREDEERIFVRADGEGVVICGGSDRAVLFGVFRFLESLGCRWLAPEPENELVPRRPTLVLEPMSLDTKPAFRWRMFSGRRTAESEAWGLKMGLNGLYGSESAAANGACYYYPNEIDGVHTWYKIIPTSRDFAVHPEWYPLIDGRRVATDVH